MRRLALLLALLVAANTALAQDAATLAEPAQDGALPIAPVVHFTIEDGVDLAVVKVAPGAMRVRILAAAGTWQFASLPSLRCQPLDGAVTVSAQEAEDCRKGEALQAKAFDPNQSLLLGEYLGLSGAVAVLSGGYLESFDPPRALGLVTVDGVQLNKRHRSWLTTAVICSSATAVVIGEIAAVDTAAYDSCLQAGPLIVDDGASRYAGSPELVAGEKKLLKSPQEQAFACIDAEGALVLGYAERVRLEPLAEFLAGELGCQHAMRLSGHITAGLATPGQIFGYNEVPLHNAIGIIPLE